MRNNWREEGRRRLAAEIAYLTAFLTDRFQQREINPVLSEIRQSRNWSRPALGELKLNSDGAFHSSNKDGGWGFAVRDDSSHVLRSGADLEESPS